MYMFMYFYEFDKKLYYKIKTPKRNVQSPLTASSAMELQLGVCMQVFADHTRRNKCKANASTIFMHRAMFDVCLSLYICTWQITVILWEETWISPVLAQWWEKRWCRFWDLWSISVGLALTAGFHLASLTRYHGYPSPNLLILFSVYNLCKKETNMDAAS